MKKGPHENPTCRNWLFVIPAVIVSGLLLSVLISPWGQSLEEGPGLDTLFLLRGQRLPPERVVVVAISEHSAAALDLPESLPDWPRSVYARLVRGLIDRHVNVIAFDIFFKTAGHDSADQDFAGALREAGNAILFAFTERTVKPVGAQQLLMDQVREPLPLLRDSARATAPFFLPKASSKVTRYWLRWNGQPPRWTLPSAALLGGQGDLAPDSSVLDGYGDSQVYNFYGPPRTIRTLALEDLLLDAASFAQVPEGAAVFVGYSARYQPGQRDGFYTPFTSTTGLDISGVELAATAYANLYDGSFIRYQLSVWVTVVLFYALLQFSVGLLLPLRFAVPLILVLAMAYALLTLWQFEHRAYWLPWVTPLLLLTPCAILLSAWRRVHYIRAQKLRLEVAFGHYLPAAEIHRLAGSSGRLAERETLFGVCLVTDAQNYTALAEKLAPLELGQVLTAYYAAIIPAIRKHGGIISDVAGDGVIALWPHVAPEAVWATICPALQALQESVIAYNRAHPQYALPTRIGVHAGEVVLGHFGASDHFEYRAIGDLVNTSSRIENANKLFGTQMLISAECVDTRSLTLRCLGKFRMQGKQRPVTLYSPLRDPWNESCEHRWRKALQLLDAQQLTDARHIIQELYNETHDKVCDFYLRQAELLREQKVVKGGAVFSIDLKKID